MAGFELGFSSVGSNLVTNCSITTVHFGYLFESLIAFV